MGVLNMIFQVNEVTVSETYKFCNCYYPGKNAKVNAEKETKLINI